MTVNRPYVETLVFLGGVGADIRADVDDAFDSQSARTWATSSALTPGGRAAAAAVGAVRLGRRFVDLIGAVGDDPLADTVLTVIKQDGVSVRLVDRIEGQTTGMQFGAVQPDGATNLVIAANANQALGEVHLKKADSTIFGSDLLFVTTEIPLELVKRAIVTASGRDVPVLLNVVPVPGADLSVLDKAVLSQVDVVLTDWTGALQLAGIEKVTGPSGLDLAKRILRLGVKAVVITLAEHGSLLAVRGKHVLIDPHVVDVVDVAGAGDAYAAAFAVGLTSQSRGKFRWEQLISAGRFASAAGAAAVTQTGSYASLPSRQAVERLLADPAKPSSLSAG